MVISRKIIILLFVLGNVNLLSAERIFYNVNSKKLLDYMDSTLLPTYLPSGKMSYWQFYNQWSFTGYTDKSKIMMEGDDISKANVWSYGYYDGNGSYIQFNVISDGNYLYPFYMQQSGVNMPYNNTSIVLKDTQFLPTERDWQTCKEFITKLTSSTSFLETYNSRTENCIVAVTLGYSANTFAEQDTNTLYWSAALIDTIDGQQSIHYCYADAYDLENIYCYTTSIKEEVVAHTNLSPNPSNTTTTLTFDLEQSGNLRISLNNLLGDEIMELHNEFTNTGTFTKTFSTANLSKGIYYLKIFIGDEVKVEKIVVD